MSIDIKKLIDIMISVIETDNSNLNNDVVFSELQLFDKIGDGEARK